MINHRLECIDIGSDYCPCYLAELNECIVCSQLQGKEFCDCNWNGVCVYQDFIWSKRKAKAKRETIVADIIDKQNINKNLIILTLSVSNKMARDLNEPGSYVFLRDESSPSFFDAPMSIMYADEISGIIKIAVQINGPKTNLINSCGKHVFLRGPYWNGLFGHKYIKGTRNSKCLVILRGIAQAPGAIIINKLYNNNNEITVIIDKGKVEEFFIWQYINNFNLKIITTDLLSNDGQDVLKNAIADKDIKLIYSGGSDEQHLNILNYLDLLDSKAYFAVSNNNTICCGEGICGSCEVQIDGQKIRSCKVQLDVRKTIERRVLHG
ncbi:hypothetical protein Thexy_1222 [Thermoanaerobacterium xylanolyticum LX-11]|uniref:Uncharacterized protein n=1 Tax=Thermoanaerobacterium xylanolyticum (strain ATCC 49914 / DSM 7097 / LX-11) TaxID=858215 RepID=F6BLK8_THEXL|nr:sulfide/dihydroorotate dehydrogenase-like FAD/NAD-binding protein [Thermoanaerobacterium xylanolyticum]AEF17255.1 hypothetical protein Thexy_1222 [Thermoanaerobacterium xylanolyticum LX-11]